MSHTSFLHTEEYPENLSQMSTMGGILSRKKCVGHVTKVMVAVRQERHMYHLIETSLTSLIKWKFTKQSLHICTDVTLMTTVYINTEYHKMQ